MKYKSLYRFECLDCDNEFNRKYTTDSILQDGSTEQEPPEIYKDKQNLKKIKEITCKCGSKKVNLIERTKIVDC